METNASQVARLCQPTVEWFSLLSVLKIDGRGCRRARWLSSYDESGRSLRAECSRDFSVRSSARFSAGLKAFSWTLKPFKLSFSHESPAFFIQWAPDSLKSLHYFLMNLSDRLLESNGTGQFLLFFFVFKEFEYFRFPIFFFGCV